MADAIIYYFKICDTVKERRKSKEKFNQINLMKIFHFKDTVDTQAFISCESWRDKMMLRSNRRQ